MELSNTPYSFEPNDDFEKLRSYYDNDFFSTIEGSNQKNINLFYKKVLPCLSVKYDNKFACLFTPCIETKKCFATKQSYLRHLQSKHSKELPGEGKFLTPNSQYYGEHKCKYCNVVFKRKDKLMEHQKNIKYCKDKFEEEFSHIQTDDSESENEQFKSKVVKQAKLDNFTKYIKLDQSSTNSQQSSRDSLPSSSKIIEDKKNIQTETNTDDFEVVEDTQDTLAKLTQESIKLNEKEIEQPWSDNEDENLVLSGIEAVNWVYKSKMKRDLSSFSLCGSQSKKPKTDDNDIKEESKGLEDNEKSDCCESEDELKEEKFLNFQLYNESNNDDDKDILEYCLKNGF